jgi:DNA-binding XRE family transcriptional regulator
MNDKPVLKITNFIYIRNTSDDPTNEQTYIQKYNMNHWKEAPSEFKNCDQVLPPTRIGLPFRYFYKTTYIPLDSDMYLEIWDNSFLLAPSFSHKISDVFENDQFFNIAGMEILGYEFLSPIERQKFDSLLEAFEKTKPGRIQKNKAEFTSEYTEYLTRWLDLTDQYRKNTNKPPDTVT